VVSLSACSPAEPKDETESAAAGGAKDYKAKPDPIPDDQIAETLEADVVVVGAGTSGTLAAVMATESGAKVIVLQKEDAPITNGMGFGAYDPDIEHPYDVQDAITRWMRESEGRSDRRLIRRWIQYSGAACKKIYELCKDSDEIIVGLTTEPEAAVYPDEWNFAYSFGGVFIAGKEVVDGGTRIACKIMLDKAESDGAEVLYSTPAKQLVQDASGRVTGVIAQREDDTYIKVNAKNGVILAAGDYGNNADFRREYMPHIEGLASAYIVQSNVGDGHLMGLWAGAKMQLGPHAGNIHYDPVAPPAPNVGGSGCPWLWVNLKGERFCNEDISYGQIYAQAMNQPEFIHFQVFDDDYLDQVYAGRMGEGNQKTGLGGGFAGYGMAFIQDAIDSGEIPSADTIEELAAKIEVPPETLAATVARYNEIFDLGVDEDFGKQAARITAIRKPPYYAIMRKPRLLCSLGGLVINDNMEVLDEAGEVIPGLWASGNNSGNWFGGLEHPMVMPGMSLARAAVTGYLAGLSAAGKTY
jgi:fumarate reductase flavoprotein subunit